jgi:hypothetical protein
MPKVNKKRTNLKLNGQRLVWAPVSVWIVREDRVPPTAGVEASRQVALHNGYHF